MTPLSAALPSLSCRPGKVFGAIPAVALLLCASLLAALEAPSKPFLDRNSSHLSSAGFRVRVANDAAGRKALEALPPHASWFIAPVTTCAISMPSQPLRLHLLSGRRRTTRITAISWRSRSTSPTNVAPDYKTRASALLYGDPCDCTLNQPDSIADYLRTHY
jgi:hypothetical protein